MVLTWEYSMSQIARRPKRNVRSSLSPPVAIRSVVDVARPLARSITQRIHRRQIDLSAHLPAGRASEGANMPSPLLQIYEHVALK